MIGFRNNDVYLIDAGWRIYPAVNYAIVGVDTYCMAPDIFGTSAVTEESVFQSVFWKMAAIFV